MHAYVCGSLEDVLPCCSNVMVNGVPQPISHEMRLSLQEDAVQYNHRCVRTVAVAMRLSPYNNLSKVSALHNKLTLIGYYTVLNPVEMSLNRCVQKCRSGGVRLLLLAEDREKAHYLAGEAGILGENDLFVEKTDGNLLSGWLEDPGNRCAVICASTSEEKKTIVKEVRQLWTNTVCVGSEMRDLAAMSEAEYQVFDMIRTRDNQQYTLRLPLLGEYQRQNLTTVCAVADFLHENTPLSISRRAFVEGLRECTSITGFRGRWDVISTTPLTICDTAHNAHGLERVASQLSKVECDKLLCVMGFCEDKDIKSILALMPTTAHYIFTRANSRRAAKTETLAALATELNLDFECCDDLKSAVELAKSKMGANDALYIGGSTFVVAEVLEREE